MSPCPPPYSAVGAPVAGTLTHAVDMYADDSCLTEVRCQCCHRYKAKTDATKAMQQLDNMDIAGNQISVTIAPLSQAEAAAAAAAAATALDLDDAEGAHQCCGLLCVYSELLTWYAYALQ